MGATMEPPDLPIAGTQCERADAARNRQLILAAAGRLFTRDGVACTSMDAIAAEAGVGKGTLFRRFGDRASLALALMEDGGRAFQEGFIRGPAPLGPGAPPVERLVAFGRGLLELTVSYGDLILAAQDVGPRKPSFPVDPSGVYRIHVAMLLREAAPDLDAAGTAEALLASLSGQVVLHQIRERGRTPDDLADCWDAIVRRLCAPSSG